MGALKVVSFRPFPTEALAKALAGVKKVAVFEKACPWAARASWPPTCAPRSTGTTGSPEVSSFVVGLGGKDVTPDTIRKAVEMAEAGYVDSHFMELDEEFLRETAAVRRRLAIKYHEAPGSETGSPRRLAVRWLRYGKVIRRWNTRPLMPGHRACAGLRRGPRRPPGHGCRGRERDHRQRHRLPGGVLQQVSRVGLGRAVDPLPLRECPRRGFRHRGRAEGAGQGRRDQGGGPGRRRGHRRHRLRRALRHVGARPRHPLHLLRQRSLHEHRHPALGPHPLRRPHQHQPRRRAKLGQRDDEEGSAGHRRGPRGPLRGDVLGGLSPRHPGQGEAGPEGEGSQVPADPRPLPAGLGLRLGCHHGDGQAGGGDAVSIPSSRWRTASWCGSRRCPEAKAGGGVPEGRRAATATSSRMEGGDEQVRRSRPSPTPTPPSTASGRWRSKRP